MTLTTGAKATDPAQARFGAARKGPPDVPSSCASKTIENTLQRLPGVSDIHLNYATEILSVRLDENRTDQDDIENNIRALGYKPQPLERTKTGEKPASEGGEAEGGAGKQSWWSIRTGRLVIGLGALLGLPSFSTSSSPRAASPWSATASMTRRPWRRRVSGSRWATAPTSLWRRRKQRCSRTEWSAWPNSSRSRVRRSPISDRTSRSRSGSRPSFSRPRRSA